MVKIHQQNQTGFTIVELLIVIVVIAILAAISVVTFNGIQERGRQSKISADLSTLSKAIMAARVNASSPLKDITSCGYTLYAATATCNGTSKTNSCFGVASGTDLTVVTGCYLAYNAALDKISTSSGINVRGLLDPWNRPYMINENEAENTATNCEKDMIGVYVVPHVTQSIAAITNKVNIPNFTQQCL